MMQQEIKAKEHKKLKKATAALMALTMAFSLSLPAAAAEEGREYLVPMGSAVGIEMQTEGIMVVGLSPVETEKGSFSPAEQAGLLPGDLIVRVGCTDTLCAEALTKALAGLSGEAVPITVRRAGRLIQYSVVPLMGAGGSYQLGLWLRDRVTGVGTLTYFDPQSGAFGALGHAITDAQTGELMPLGGGVLTDAAIVDVRAGTPGTPGELCGVSDGADKRGDIDTNTLCGIFGTMTPGGMALREALPVAEEAEIALGAATILTTVNGRETDEYTVEITRIYHDSGDGRSMMLTVTDPRLLAVTGGIVQGMSGSPIIQNGRLVGAVTHVLVADPARGYGVSLRQMMGAAEAAQAQKPAA